MQNIEKRCQGRWDEAMMGEISGIWCSMIALKLST